MTLKQEGWEQRLRVLIDARRWAPHVWGANDCCALVLAAARACRGSHEPIPAYASERGAWRVLRGLGGGIEQAADRIIGQPLPLPALAQRADVVMVAAPGLFRHALAVCAGPVAYVPGPAGLVAVPPALWLKAWRM